MARLQGPQPGQRDKATNPVGNSIFRGGGEEYGEWQGYVATEYGYVLVNSIQWYGDDIQRTDLRIIYNSRLHTRHIDKYYWPLTLVTLAKRFAADVAAGRVTT